MSELEKQIKDIQARNKRVGIDTAKPVQISQTGGT